MPGAACEERWALTLSQGRIGSGGAGDGAQVHALRCQGPSVCHSPWWKQLDSSAGWEPMCSTVGMPAVCGLVQGTRIAMSLYALHLPAVRHLLPQAATRPPAGSSTAAKTHQAWQAQLSASQLRTPTWLRAWSRACSIVCGHQTVQASWCSIMQLAARSFASKAVSRLYPQLAAPLPVSVMECMP